jgi:hypothetical protein
MCALLLGNMHKGKDLEANGQANPSFIGEVGLLPLRCGKKRMSCRETVGPVLQKEKSESGAKNARHQAFLLNY